MPAIPATQKAEAELLEPRKQSLQWAKIAPLHSSLVPGDRARLCLKKKRKTTYKPEVNGFLWNTSQYQGCEKQDCGTISKAGKSTWQPVIPDGILNQKKDVSETIGRIWIQSVSSGIASMLISWLWSLCCGYLKNLGEGHMGMLGLTFVKFFVSVKLFQK